MKVAILAVLAAIPLVLVARQPSADEIAYYQARRHGAKVRECIRVVDQDGVPVDGAKMWGGLQTGDGYNDYTSIDGFTDSKGEFLVKGKCTEALTLRITKDGYYKTDARISYRSTAAIPKVKDGKWQPYDSQRTIVLNKIVNPRPMCVHNARTSFKVPKHGEWLGFDCEKYDFVPPHGHGAESDMLLRFTLVEAAPHDRHMTMEVSFTNHPHAGAYELDKYAMSELQSVYHADADAAYRRSFSYSFDEFPDKVGEYTKQLKADKYLVFRTRTKVDADGRLVSAHYGKIYGDWHFFGPAGMSAEFFVFNPTPNDTNLEDKYSSDASIRQKMDREAPPYRKSRVWWKIGPLRDL
ncbi:MAG: hypothetical protein ACI4RA_10185 [Kiritimatiellia bacterium]